MNAATTTRHRLLMTDVNLVQVNYTRMFVWMDHGFTQLLHDPEHPSSTLLRQGWSTPVVDAHCSYVRTVTLDDEFNLWIRTHPQHTAMRVPEWLRQAVVPRESAPISNGKARSTGESSPGTPQLSLSPNVPGSEYSPMTDVANRPRFIDAINRFHRNPTERHAVSTAQLKGEI